MLLDQTHPKHRELPGPEPAGCPQPRTCPRPARVASGPRHRQRWFIPRSACQTLPVLSAASTSGICHPAEFSVSPAFLLALQSLLKILTEWQDLTAPGTCLFQAETFSGASGWDFTVLTGHVEVDQPLVSTHFIRSNALVHG